MLAMAHVFIAHRVDDLLQAFTRALDLGQADCGVAAGSGDTRYELFLEAVLSGEIAVASVTQLAECFGLAEAFLITQQADLQETSACHRLPRASGELWVRTLPTSPIQGVRASYHGDYALELDRGIDTSAIDPSFATLRTRDSDKPINVGGFVEAGAASLRAHPTGRFCVVDEQGYRDAARQSLCGDACDLIIQVERSNPERDVARGSFASVLDDLCRASVQVQRLAVSRGVVVPCALTISQFELRELPMRSFVTQPQRKENPRSATGGIRPRSPAQRFRRSSRRSELGVRRSEQSAVFRSSLSRASHLAVLRSAGGPPSVTRTHEPTRVSDPMMLARRTPRETRAGPRRGSAANASDDADPAPAGREGERP